jgi:hypothetical protein
MDNSEQPNEGQNKKKMMWILFGLLLSGTAVSVETHVDKLKVPGFIHH